MKLRVFDSLDRDYFEYGGVGMIVIDTPYEFRVIRIPPKSTTYIEDWDD